MAWTVTSNTPSWLQIATDAQGTAIANMKTGIGNATLYAYASAPNTNKDTPRKTIFTLTHKGISDSSKKTIEVTQKYTPVANGEKSNSYILPPGTAVAIPVIRANESPLAIGDNKTQLQSETPWTASLIWESDKGLISLSAPAGTGPSGRFTVVAPNASAQGNAVVAIKNANNEILWSWHIWVTTYDGSTTFTTNNGKRDFVFMDRALGATSVTPGELSSCGLLYQWGRKDPFPGIGQRGGGWSFTNYTDPIRVYNSLGNLYAIPRELVPPVTPNNLTKAFRNPDTFYYSADPPDDWFVYDGSSAQNDDLWGGGDIAQSTADGKTVFDPCPAGWRVPPWLNNTSPFEGMRTGLTASLNGVSWAGTGGYFPNSRGRTTYGLVGLGGGGSYWTGASANDTKANLFEYELKTLGIAINGGHARRYAYGIRCVKE